MHKLQELVRYHRLGCGPREAARLLEISHNTEQRYRRAIEKAGLLAGDPGELPDPAALREAVKSAFPPEACRQLSTVEAYRQEISDKLNNGAQPQAIHDYLRLKYDGKFTGSLSAVKRLCKRLRREQGVPARAVAIPVETEPGQSAQVDFGYLGGVYDPASGSIRKVWLFVMVLGYSRKMFVDLVFNQKAETWIGLHIRAFEYFGGVPAVVVPDNLKAAVTRAAFTSADDCEINRSYRDLARHYGFLIDPTPPYQPQMKGKVESGVKYVKNNFGKPRTFVDIDDARAQLGEWLEKVANCRIHGTTRRRPAEMFAAEEAEHLLPLSAVRFDTVIWKKAKVHQDTHFQFDGRLYSVHFKNIGREVWVRATAKTVEAYLDDERAATHDRNGKGRRCTIEEHLPDHRVDWARRGRDFWEEKAAAIGPEVGEYISAVFDSDKEHSQLRAAQAIVTHLEKFPVGRACAAATRAHYYGNYSYKAVKNILQKGLDLTEPSPWDEPRYGVIGSARYARDVSELVARSPEVCDGND
jgi:transposase